jgi:hypothetical protein
VLLAPGNVNLPNKTWLHQLSRSAEHASDNIKKNSNRKPDGTIGARKKVAETERKN